MEQKHSSTIGRVWHLSTGYVSPQYHVVYNDLFKTTFAGRIINNATSDALFDKLFKNVREEYAPAEYDDLGRIIFEPPPLDDIWLSEGERRDKRVNLRRRQVREREQWTKNQEQVQNSPDPTSDPSSPPSNHPNAYSDIPAVSDDEDSDDESIETQFDQPAQNTDAEGADDIQILDPPVHVNT